MPTQPARAPSPGRVPAPDEKKLVWSICGLLLLAVALVYGQALRHGFLYFDDNGFVFDNPHVNSGLTTKNIEWAFTDGPYGEWYPLAPLSHMLDCQLYGAKPEAAWGHHLTNVLLHAATSIGLFLVLWRMTSQRAVPDVAQVVPAIGARSGTSERREGRVSGPERDNTGRVASAGPSATTLWPSALVAGLLAVHPQHVESVAWLAERRDVLSGLFFVLTLGAYWGYLARGRKPLDYLWVAALFSLGLMAKPMLVTLPLLLLLLDYWPLGRIGSAADIPPSAPADRPGAGRLILEKLPLLALALGDCWMTIKTHNAGGIPLALLVRIGNAAVSAVAYLADLFYPVGLSPFYRLPPEGQPMWQVSGACAILIVVSALAIIARRRCPYLFVGWFWYLGMLAPVLGLVHLSTHARADRYTYLPSVGIYIALAFGGARLVARWPNRRRAFSLTAGSAIVVLAALAARQTTFWRDDASLWTHALTCDPENGEAEFGLAHALQRQGHTDEAIAHYRRSAEHAVDSSPWINIGLLLAREGKFDEAIAAYQQALAFDATSALAVQTHVHWGEALAELKHFNEAHRQFDLALNMNPRSVGAHVGLAHLLRQQGQLDQARVELERAVEIDPERAATHNDLGTVLFEQSQPSAAIDQFAAAVAVDPRFIPARLNLAAALASRGRFEEAIEQCRQVLEIDANHPSARQMLERYLQRRR